MKEYSTQGLRIYIYIYIIIIRYRKHKLQDRLLEQQILEDDISTGFGGAFPDPVSGNKLSDVDSDSESNESDSESPSSSAIPCTTYKTKLIESPLTNKKTEVENVGSENMKVNNIIYIYIYIEPSIH